MGVQFAVICLICTVISCWCQSSGMGHYEV